MDKLVIGKIVKPQGIKGELKISPLVDSPDVILGLKSVYIEGKEYKIISARAADGVYLFLSGVADRNAAETLRGKDVLADRKELPLPEGRWFLTDIIGSKIAFDTGDFVGIAVDVATRGSTDIFTVKTDGGKTIMFPFLKDLIVSVDVGQKLITLKKSRFDEVALYED